VAVEPVRDDEHPDAHCGTDQHGGQGSEEHEGQAVSQPAQVITEAHRTQHEVRTDGRDRVARQVAEHFGPQ
jgi:hypothetical protein